jgi:nicotinamide-nucleotide amidase
MAADALTTLATLAGTRLKTKHLKLATAESCTGGWVAQAVTAIAGSSDWFERGYVTYSNESKQELLGVKDETLARHGAVSEETACEMALGALRGQSGARMLAVAITGVAGPSGGTVEKPVGMVCFAWRRTSGAVRSETRRFKGDREAVRRQSVIRALQGIIESLDEAEPQG